MSCHICGYHIFILGNIVVTRHSESWDITGSGLFCHDKKLNSDIHKPHFD